MNTRGVRQSTLEKKLTKWQKILKLSDWEITIRYATKKDLEEIGGDKERNDIALVSDCDTAAKRATILINRNYHKMAGYKKSWNVDTLILHELIHVVVWLHSEAIPDKIYKHRKVYEFEEFICDCFADVIYRIYYNKL